MWLTPEGADKEHYAAAVLLDDIDERTVAVEVDLLGLWRGAYC